MSEQQHLPEYAKGDMVLELDLDYIEELAALGFSDRAIAEALCISSTTWKKYEMRDPNVADAVFRGRTKIRRDILKKLKNDRLTGPLFLSKQEFILDFKDQRDLNVSGEIRHTLTPAEEVAKKRLNCLSDSTQKQISEPIEVKGEHIEAPEPARSSTPASTDED